MKEKERKKQRRKERMSGNFMFRAPASFFGHFRKYGNHVQLFVLILVPNQQRWFAKWKLSWNVYSTVHTYSILHTHVFFCMFGADLYAQTVLSNKKFCIEAQSKVY